ncbi:hypothetical protein D3C81_2005630 [compost metagenome]
MLNRGVGGAAIDNVLKVTKGLGITVDELEQMVENERNGIDSESNESKMTAAEIAELEAFINNPENNLFFKELLDAPEKSIEDLRKVWEIIKRSSNSEENK